MSLPFAPKRFRAYEIEFGSGGQRLGCKFLLDDGSLLFVHESQITPEIEKDLVKAIGDFQTHYTPPAGARKQEAPKLSGIKTEAATTGVKAAHH